jgi:hypothetical protein
LETIFTRTSAHDIFVTCAIRSAGPYTRRARALCRRSRRASALSMSPSTPRAWACRGLLSFLIQSWAVPGSPDALARSPA